MIFKILMWSAVSVVLSLFGAACSSGDSSSDSTAGSADSENLESVPDTTTRLVIEISATGNTVVCDGGSNPVFDVVGVPGEAFTFSSDDVEIAEPQLTAEADDFGYFRFEYSCDQPVTEVAIFTVKGSVTQAEGSVTVRLANADGSSPTPELTTPDSAASDETTTTTAP